MLVANVHSLPMLENITGIGGYPQLPFIFTRLANFKDLSMCQTVAWELEKEAFYSERLTFVFTLV